MHAFVRCLVCNGELALVAKADILDRLEPKTRLYYEVFYQCVDCRCIYWEGAHMENMRRRLDGFLFAVTET
ncbi:MAG: Mut7-C RNAse domain-containing protein [Methylococcaceae bacterium]|nr:Mut7-C RNAse domain-containing protein [Methylococcaceae bacterium]